MTTSTGLPDADAETAPRAAAPAASGLRRVLEVAGTVVAVVVVTFLSLVFAFIPSPPAGEGAIPPELLWHMTGAATAVGCGVAMIWRRRFPVPLLLGTAVASIVLPVGPVASVVVLPWVIARGTRRTLGWAIPLTVAAVAVPLVTDALRPAEHAVLSLSDPAGGKTPMPWVAYAIIGVLLVGGSLTAGFLRRSRAELDVAHGTAQAAARQVGELRDELTRQEEREHIAREMHDTVAHHLSLLSLHAAALEVTSQDPAVPDAARSMRASAHQALEEMRGLITSLRDSSDGGYSGSAPTLGDLGRLVEDARAAGVEIAASVDLPAEPGVEVATATTRAVYRIVQEALTNALKHAPGSGVSVQVAASPEHGVRVAVVSWLPAGGAAAPHARTGAGAGVVGMRERAESLGGTLHVGPIDNVWVVSAWLPWR